MRPAIKEKGLVKYKINIGDKIPRFHAKDERGDEYTSADLMGCPLVIYFYPKDETPGCTKEACSFRDNIAELKALSALVIGVSPDSVFSHRQFVSKHQLSFPLFSDENKEICHLFDVIREKVVDGIKKKVFERSTFVFDQFGRIAWIERPVNVDGHTERVIAAVKKLQ